MEKIFKECRFTVEDNGFSDKIMRHIKAELSEPKKNVYRIPTLIASACSVIAIVIVALTMELGEISQKYENFVDAYQNEQYAKFAQSDQCLLIDDLDEENDVLQNTDFQRQ